MIAGGGIGFGLLCVRVEATSIYHVYFCFESAGYEARYYFQLVGQRVFARGGVLGRLLRHFQGSGFYNAGILVGFLAHLFYVIQLLTPAAVAIYIYLAFNEVIKAGGIADGEAHGKCRPLESGGFHPQRDIFHSTQLAGL